LARLLEANTESSDEQRIHTLYLLTLGRPPEEVEVQSGRQFLEIYQAEIDPDNSRQRAAKTAESLASTSYESQIRGTAGLVAYYRLNERGPHKKGQPVVANHVGGGKADGLYVGNPALGRPGAIHAASPDKNIVSHEFFGQGGLRMVADARSVAEVNQWTHVVFTFGDSRRRLYVNGQMVDELNVSGNFGAGPVPLTLGARRDNVEWLQAGLDEVAIYNRVLEGSTVRRHYTVGSGHPPKEDGPYSPRLMAWRRYCQALLCMNEFIFVD
jgi:hypothetical protein